jgi:hypothetical protein
MKKFKSILKKFFIGIITILVLAILILAISIPVGKSSESPIENPGISYKKIVLTNANVIPMTTDTVLKNQHIYIVNGKIIDINSDTFSIQPDYTEINIKGAYVVPGLIDMHAHIFDRTDLPQYLSYGVTTVRNMMGFPMHLRWKDQLKNNEFPGSMLITATPTLNSGNNAGPFHKIITTETEAKEMIELYANAGYDFVKVYDDVELPVLKVIEETAKDHNLMVVGHPPAITLKALLSSSLVSIEHVEELRKFLDEENSEASMKAVAKQLKQSNKAVTINLIAFYRVYKTAMEGQPYLYRLNLNKINPVTAFISQKQLGDYTEAGSGYKAFAAKKFAALQRFAKILTDEGVTILFGTDSGPNFITPGNSIHEEIALLTDAGISAYDILKSATINASSVLQKSDLGQITIGYKADLLILNENPLTQLETLKNPRMIVTGNYYYTENEIKKLRSIGETKQSTYATIGLFLEHLINK